MNTRGNRWRRQRRIMVGFDPETFRQIAGWAKTNHVSFAEMTRTLVTWGMESAGAD